MRGVIRVTNVEGFKEAWIRGEERRLLDPLPKPPPLGLGSAQMQGLFSSAARISEQFDVLGASLRYKEERDEDEYRTAVADYLDELLDYSFTHELAEALDELEPGLRPEFTVTNRSEVNLEELDLDIHLPGDVIGFEATWQPPADRPKRPRLWDVAPKGHPSRQFEDLGRQFDISSVADLHIGDAGPGPTKPPFRNSGSVDLNYFLVHLRPVASESLERGKVVVAPKDVRTEILAQWQATARNANKLFSGTVLVPVREIDAASLVAEL